MIRMMSVSELEAVITRWRTYSQERLPHFPDTYWNEAQKELLEITPHTNVYLFEEDGRIQSAFSVIEGYHILFYILSENASQVLNYLKERYDELAVHVYVQDMQTQTFFTSQGFTVIETLTDENTGTAMLEMYWEMT